MPSIDCNHMDASRDGCASSRKNVLTCAPTSSWFSVAVGTALGSLSTGLMKSQPASEATVTAATRARPDHFLVSMIYTPP